nr:hypothetical protein [uncultured Moellerella sp.]
MFSHLQRIAAAVIPQQSLLWYRFEQRSLDERGHYQNQYYPAEQIFGSWQAVDSQELQEMGFASHKIYRRFYTSFDIKKVQGGTAPDYLVFLDKRYEVVGDADWYQQDGWKSVLCIEVGENDG